MATPRLDLPQMADGEGSGYVTFNQLAQILDAVLNTVVQSESLTTPPLTPNEGECWYVPAGGTGAWVGQSKKIAQWYGGVWAFHTLPIGTYVWVADTFSRKYVDANGNLAST